MLIEFIIAVSIIMVILIIAYLVRKNKLKRDKFSVTDEELDKPTFYKSEITSKLTPDQTRNYYRFNITYELILTHTEEQL